MHPKGEEIWKIPVEFEPHDGQLGQLRAQVDYLQADPCGLVAFITQRQDFVCEGVNYVPVIENSCLYPLHTQANLFSWLIGLWQTLRAVCPMCALLSH